MSNVYVGYQGALYSNSYRAACTGFPHILDDTAILIPLVTSATIAENLRNESIDYGVVAIENSLGGIVTETERILDTGDFEIVSESSISIHHCLFKHPDVDLEDIDVVASHIQALIQTRMTRMSRFDEYVEQEIEDTAIGAAWLSDGTLPKNTAILCPKEAGEAYELDLIAENLEDARSFTTFGLIRLAGTLGNAV